MSAFQELSQLRLSVPVDLPDVSQTLASMADMTMTATVSVLLIAMEKVGRPAQVIKSTTSFIASRGIWITATPHFRQWAIQQPLNLHRRPQYNVQFVIDN